MKKTNIPVNIYIVGYGVKQSYIVLRTETIASIGQRVPGTSLRNNLKGKGVAPAHSSHPSQQGCQDSWSLKPQAGQEAESDEFSLFYVAKLDQCNILHKV